ncbi:glycosyltransferase family protein [Clostridium neonatale]|uniref:glycosyltransferase family protein n=1 Tax=Clostridium neonatale TaxID=137838 RepID=UPI003D324DD2
MKNILVYKGKSQYNVLNYFAESLASELNLLHPTKCIDLSQENSEEILINEADKGVELTIGFNAISSKYTYIVKNIPHISIFVDHPMCIYDNIDLTSKNIYISCVDEERVNFIRNKLNFDNVFILNHAVDRNIEHNIYGDKTFDIVMLGGLKNPEKLRLEFKDKYHFNKQILQLIDYVGELALNNSVFPIEDLLDSVIQIMDLDIEISDISSLYRELFCDIELYFRTISRKRAIESFKEYNIDVFGNIESGIFPMDSKVNIHNAIDNKQALEVLRNSKISLNNSKFIYNGSHERVLLAAACGSVNLTNKTSYFENTFKNSAIYYNDLIINLAKEQVEEVLKNDKKRIEMCLKANEVVMKNHTWKNRAEQIISMI